MSFYIASSDHTQHILPAFAHQADKYYMREWKVLGYSKFPGLPMNYEKISMGKSQISINNWTKDLHNVIKDDPNEIIGFGLDDYLIIDEFDINIWDRAISYMHNNPKVGRYEMGYGAHRKKDIEMIDDLIFRYGPESYYRVSCQMSYWRKEYLLKFLNNDWTPWQFEIKGSEMSNNDGWDIIGTAGRYALRVIEESVLSGRHPGKYNVLGLKPDDLKELINLGYIDKDNLQYGMSKGDNPKTLDINNIGIKYRGFYE